MAHRYGRRQPNLIESTTLWASRANRSNEAAGASIETSTGKPPRLRAWIRTRLPRMTVNGAAGPEYACAPGFSFPGIPNSAAVPTKAGALMQPFGTPATVASMRVDGRPRPLIDDRSCSRRKGYADRYGTMTRGAGRTARLPGPYISTSGNPRRCKQVP